MRRIRGVLVVLAVAALAACSSGGSESSDGGGADMAGPEVSQEQAEAGDGASVSDQGAVGRDVATETGERQVITTAHATVVVDDPEEAATDLAALTTAAGGHVQNRSVHQGEDDADYQSLPSASMTLRVPSAELEGVLTDLTDLGDVRDISQSSEDVTRTIVDLDARISALETSTARLEEIMAGAETSADLIDAEAALSERQAELESLLSQREHLADQVAMSTLHVELTTEPAPEVTADGFVGGLQTGWQALVSFVSVLVVTVGVLLPWLVLLAIPAAIIFVVTKRRRRRNTAPAGESEPEVAHSESS
ncbi:DUF4349 domain-containing protein [Ruania halotolerans]|uniref:DUF4349 domain-containing protein n=1 Tax=Ruania halotolerans TaxID=2897773 RepID=UPI001E4CBA7B|nr:DUF4349 domain-containing protein [Ruania halotolerans]UFU06161.1 DUF4349 domain-containing protein [Ruania halotolerans]